VELIDIKIGDCREVLKTIPDKSVHCVVTSPPYYGLRDYGTAKWEGGDSECDHNNLSEYERDPKNPNANSHIERFNREKCYKCGAIRVDRQIGLEQTPEEYVNELVNVFREVKRVLRDDGTLWLNLGDSYASGKGSCFNPGGGENSLGKERKEAGAHPLNRGNKSDLTRAGLKPKDLIGIPWRVAFALQADGWYLRQDIIWSKNNPMPESVKDRCTKSHEYIFLLSKSKKYYFDSEAIKEESVCKHSSGNGYKRSYRVSYQNKDGTPRGNDEHWSPAEKRNKRSVWHVNTKPYKGAHYATFPGKLIEPCILAGCPENGIVLDPFGGSGTVAEQCIKFKRNAILIELNPENEKLMLERFSKVQTVLVM